MWASLSLPMLIFFYICEKISPYVLFRNGSTFNADETNILDYMQENPQGSLFTFEFILWYVVFNFFLLKNEVLFHHFIVIRVKLLYILLFLQVTHSFAFTYSSMLTLICCIQGYFHPVVFLLSFSCKRFFFSSWIVKKKFIKVRWYAKLQLAHSSIRPLTTRAKKKTGENFTVQKRHN